jgi:hypothetical protein
MPRFGQYLVAAPAAGDLILYKDISDGRTKACYPYQISNGVLYFDPTTGNIALGIDNLDAAKLEIFDDSGDPQLRLTYDEDVDFATFYVDDNGYLTINDSGGVSLIKKGGETFTNSTWTNIKVGVLGQLYCEVTNTATIPTDQNLDTACSIGKFVNVNAAAMHSGFYLYNRITASSRGLIALEHQENYKGDMIIRLRDGGTTSKEVVRFDTDGDVTGYRYFRSVASNYRRYYHMPTSSFDPGSSGATFVAPNANTVGGYQLDAVGEVLYFGSNIHADWDGATDPKVKILFAVNVDNSGGSGEDTVDLKLVCYYNGIGETSTKTQTVEVATTVGACAQYTVFNAEFTINWDETDNVVENDDVFGFILNLETDTSEVDDIVILNGGSDFYYQTTHIGIESGDV